MKSSVACGRRTKPHASLIGSSRRTNHLSVQAAQRGLQNDPCSGTALPFTGQPQRLQPPDPVSGLMEPLQSHPALSRDLTRPSEKCGKSVGWMILHGFAEVVDEACACPSARACVRGRAANPRGWGGGENTRLLERQDAGGGPPHAHLREDIGDLPHLPPCQQAASDSPLRRHRAGDPHRPWSGAAGCTVWLDLIVLIPLAASRTPFCPLIAVAPLPLRE